ncbi:MAG: EI24 domain-containing protein [Myxococcota bacterium]
MGRGFSEGMGAAFRGLGGALSDVEVRTASIRMVGVLFVAITALSVAGIWGVTSLTPIDGDAAWWVIGLYWALRVAGIVLVLFISPIVALTGVNLVFPLLAERLFYSALATVNPARAAELSARPGLPIAQGVADALHRLALFFGLSVLAFLLSLVPVLGSIGGPVVQAYLTSRSIGWEMLDPYFDKLEWRFDDQQRFVARHRSALVGFGLPISLLMMIPIVGPLIFGLAQASAAVLVADVLERPESS